MNDLLDNTYSFRHRQATIKQNLSKSFLMGFAVAKVATDTNILDLRTRYRSKLGWFFSLLVRPDTRDDMSQPWLMPTVVICEQQAGQSAKKHGATRATGTLPYRVIHGSYL